MLLEKYVLRKRSCEIDFLLGALNSDGLSENRQAEKIEIFSHQHFRHFNLFKPFAFIRLSI